MRYLWAAFAVVAIFAEPTIGGAADIPDLGDPLQIEAVVAYAAEHNPEILAARERASAAAAVPVQVSAYDDPTFSYEAWNAPDSLRLDRADNNIFRLAQKIPYPGKRSLAGAVAEHEAEMERRAVGVTALDVITAVKRAYYDLWMVHQNLRVYARDKALVQRFAHIAEQKYSVSEVPQADVVRAQVELTHMVNRQNTETFALESARADLNALLSRAPDDPLGTPPDVPMPHVSLGVAALIDRALQQRPEVAAQKAAVAREQSSVDLAQLNYRPDFEVSVGRFVNYGRNDGFGAMASVSLPFVNLAKYDARATQVKARLAAAQADLRRLQDRIGREVKQALVRVHTAEAQHTLAVTTHIPQAEQALRVTEGAYQTGNVDFLGLIDTVRRIESLHLDHAQASAEFGKAYADLERAVGGELEQHE